MIVATDKLMEDLMPFSGLKLERVMKKRQAST